MATTPLLAVVLTFVTTAVTQEPADPAQGAPPAPEVSKALIVESLEAWDARLERLRQSATQIEKEIAASMPTSSSPLSHVMTRAFSEAYLRGQLRSIAAEVTNSVTDNARRGSLPRTFHHEAVTTAKAYPPGSTFVSAMWLFCRDLPPYEPGCEHAPKWTDEQLTTQLLGACRRLRELLEPAPNKARHLFSPSAYLTPEMVEGIRRDFHSYEEHCKARRWSEAQAIGDVYWSALRGAILDGVVELPKFGAASSPATAVDAATPTSLMAPEALLAWIDRELLAVEKARGSAAADPRWQDNQHLLRLLGLTREGYAGWLAARSRMVVDQQDKIARARILAEENDRAGFADRAAADRERCARAEHQLHADLASEIRDFVLSQSQQPDQLRQTMYFCLLELETFDAKFAPFHAAVGPAMTSLREELVQRRAQARQPDADQFGAKLGAFVREFESFAEGLLVDLAKITEAQDRRDAKVMRSALAPMREALRGTDAPIEASLAAAAQPAAAATDPSNTRLTGSEPASTPAARPVVEWRLYDLDFETTKAREEAAQRRVQQIRKAMKGKRHVPTEAEYLAEWRAATAGLFYRVARERLRPMEHGQAPKRPLRLVEIQNSGAYAFAKFDPASLAAAESLAALRDAWQVARASLVREIASLEPRSTAFAVYRNEMAAKKTVLADLDRAIDLLAKDRPDELRTFLDGLWARVLAE